MRARPAIRIALAAGAIVALAAGWWAYGRRSGSATGGGPIVLISIDTLRADRLPVYGYDKIRTPHIDRLAADGIVFEQAYAHAPQTLPSHASILSGELPFQHGVRDNVGFTVRDDQWLLPRGLHDAGYTSGGFVSAYVLRHQTGIGRGFDVYDDELPAASPDRPLGQVQRAGVETLASAERWMDRLASSRFFLFFHIYEPHKPYTPPREFGAAAPYDGEVEYSDAIVGRLLDRLRAKGLYDAATIVLISDHGEGLGDHGEDEHGIFLYRETMRVPLIVKLPGAAHKGRRVAAAVQHVDLVPTILDLAGAPARASLAGRSLRPVLDGSGSLPEASIYSESLSPRYHFGWSELYALSDDRYRVIRAPRDELYDVSQDPGERRSIAAERPQVRAAMRAALDSLIANATLDQPSAVSSDDREKLAALGYIGTQSSASLQLPGDRLPDPKDKIGVLQRYKRAGELAGAQKFDEAIVEYRAVLRDDPEMSDVWLQLAEIESRAGRVSDAVAAYREVIQRNPKDAAALTGAAAGLLRLGRLDEARAHAELAVPVAPAAAHDLLARIAIEGGQLDVARREAAAAHAADATLPLPAFVDGLILHRQQQYAAALPHFLEARRALDGRTVQMVDVNYYVGDTLARLDRSAEAEPYFKAEVALFPQNARARAGLAMLYRAMGRDADSDAAIAALVRHVPTREGYDVAAQLWTMFGEPRRAAAMRADAARLPR